MLSKLCIWEIGRERTRRPSHYSWRRRKLQEPKVAGASMSLRKDRLLQVMIPGRRTVDYHVDKVSD